MRLRPPSVPLITVDPYFSVWSPADRLNSCTTEHWTGAPNTLLGTVEIDGTPYTFCGKGENCIAQTALDLTATVTTYTFQNAEITLTAEFFTPLLITDSYLLSRPVSYFAASYRANDGQSHRVTVSLAVSEEICLNQKGDFAVETKTFAAERFNAVRIGSTEQKVLNRSGDDLRIDWGYFYLGCPKSGQTGTLQQGDLTFVTAAAELSEGAPALFLLAYDDIESIQYFGRNLTAYWHTVDPDILTALHKAYGEYPQLKARCAEFGQQLRQKATQAGGEKYADLLTLAYRQVLAAHKLVVTENGELLYISKECNSNGCAATVDVTYPSAPLFLLLNPELLKGMLRPVYHYAKMPDWPYDFAPHDVGCYPLLNGQAYWGGTKRLDKQMPVEECGNMLILTACLTLCDQNADFAKPQLPLLQQWVKYLEQYGADPGEQLCTDDFGGHLAHNCNLALKAILGIAAYGIILTYLKEENAAHYLALAKKMVNHWVQTAANPDGSFRLTFDRLGTFSMKYNIIWDKIWGTNLFEPCVLNSEFLSYRRRLNAYGLPLDSRKSYTKSDWYIWVACLANYKEDFEEFIAPLWQAYHQSESRVPMTDWYSTVTAGMCSFKHRSVQGGLFLKLLQLPFKAPQ